MSNQFAPYQQQPPPFYQEPPRWGNSPGNSSGSGCWWAAGIGCLGVSVVSVLMCAGTVWYAQKNAGRWVSGMVREVVVRMIDESEIPAHEKKEVIAQVDRVVKAYQAGQISDKDFERLMQEMQKSPAFLLIIAWGMEKSYVDPSGLNADEKQAAKRTIERAFRGLCEKKITQEQFGGVMPQPAGPGGQPRQDKPSDDEVRQMLERLKKLVDDAQIPDESFTIDIGDEVKKAVDAALEGTGGP
jgi:hypothetical protein